MTVVRARLKGGDAELGRVAAAALDAEAFWRSESFAALQEAQATTGEVDPAALAMDLSDRERADFLAALAR